MPDKYRWEKAARRAKSPRGPIDRGLEPTDKPHAGCPRKGNWVSEGTVSRPPFISGKKGGFTLKRRCDGCGAVEFLGDVNWEREPHKY